MKDGTQRPSTSAETPQQPELTSDDSLRFSREASKYGQEVHGDQCPGSVYHAFRDGASYATLHERAAAQARIKKLEAALKVIHNHVFQSRTSLSNPFPFKVLDDIVNSIEP